jgi:hypothetical protein
VPPGKHPFGEAFRDQSLAAQQGKHFRPEPRLEQLARNGRQDAEVPITVKNTSAASTYVYVRIEVDEVAEGLDELPSADPRSAAPREAHGRIRRRHSTLSRYDRNTGKWAMEKAPVHHIID